MTDQELLELAAKAAGYDDLTYCEFWQCMAKWCEEDGGSFDARTCWRPLRDDGDALRIEVLLKLATVWEPMRSGWSVGGVLNGSFKWLAFHEDRKRASTMAAAEIGRAMA